MRGRRPATSVSQLDDTLKHWRRADKCEIGDQEKGIDPRGGHRRKCLSELLRTAGIGPEQLEPEGVRGVVQHLGIVKPSLVERVAEHADPDDVRRHLLQNLQALLVLVSAIERQACMLPVGRTMSPTSSAKIRSAMGATITGIVEVAGAMA